MISEVDLKYLHQNENWLFLRWCDGTRNNGLMRSNQQLFFIDSSL